MCREEDIQREEKEDKKSRSFTISAQGTNLPHIDKRHRGGEDAIFTSQDGHLLVVADGVGGWNLRGVDPSLYSRTLTQGVAEAFERGSDQSSFFLFSSNLSLISVLVADL